MSPPPDLLLITCNRREYVEKTIANLLADSAEFRLHCWDNASTDGTADLIASLSDPRIVRRHFSETNVRQRTPSEWILEVGTGDLVGKIDDDILLPHGWTERLAEAVRSEPSFGMLGCWIFMPEDWDADLASHNIVERSDWRVFRTTSIAGQSFLARRDLLKQYVKPQNDAPGFPIDQIRMSLDGYIQGYPLPLLLAHNMDDPRSPHCLMRQSDYPAAERAFTMQRLGFKTLDEYAQWIADDAKERQAVPFDQQLRRMRLARSRSPLGRLRRKLADWLHVTP